MKKIPVFLALLITSFAIITGCKTNNKEGYLLKMRLAKGDVFQNNIVADMTTTVSLMGTEQSTKLKMDIGSKFEVMDSSAEGRQLKVTYTKMEMHADMGPGNENADSILNAGNKQAVGRSVVITLKDNKVVNVSGADSLMGASSDSAGKQMLQKFFTKENMNQTFGMMFGMYPAKPVKVGDTWDSENTMEMAGLAITVKTKYTLEKVENEIAELKVVGNIDTKGEMDINGTKLDVDMKGTQNGKVFITVATGYLDHGNYDMDIDATMNMMGQKVPMKIKSTYHISSK
jgi:hypothetical protein